MSNALQRAIVDASTAISRIAATPGETAQARISALSRLIGAIEGHRGRLLTEQRAQEREQRHG